jgi:hypothetical protein
VDGSIDKHKARLVARGDRQKEGIDYFDITSPVVDASIIRFALGLAVQRGMHMAILDVPTAFLGSNLEETICMRLLECYWSDMDPVTGTGSRSRPLVKLRATLYGLKQAGRYWFEAPVSKIQSDGLSTTGVARNTGYIAKSWSDFAEF